MQWKDIIAVHYHKRNKFQFLKSEKEYDYNHREQRVRKLFICAQKLLFYEM